MGAANSNVLNGYVDFEGLGAELNCSRRTINRMMDEPDGLPHVRLRGRVLFNLDSVKRWIAEKETQRNPRVRRAGSR